MSEYTMDDLEKLKKMLIEREDEVQRLRLAIASGSQCAQVSDVVDVVDGRDDRMDSNVNSDVLKPARDYLDNHDIARYSRQLILPELGARGQLAILKSSVLIVGCGGLGCPVAIYLAGAGVGRIGLVDHDNVEVSNLHRQVQHGETSAVRGVSKAASLADSCLRLNSGVKCDIHQVILTSQTAMGLISSYDVVVDASDNVATRYLVNDACILAGRPLVSGSALRFEGQLTVYNYRGSPCFRCLFPEPPPADSVTNCSDGGVFGPVVGVIGSMQAVEALKIIADVGQTYAGRLLLYDGLDGNVRIVKLRARRLDCAVCGDCPTITQLIDYEQFCGSSATDTCKHVKLLSNEERVTVSDYASIVHTNEPHFLVDVRTSTELGICKLPSTTHNVPMAEFSKMNGHASLLELLKHDVEEKIASGQPAKVFVVCRRGNDSQIAVKKLQQYLDTKLVEIKDLIGGLYSWTNVVNPDFPKY